MSPILSAAASLSPDIRQNIGIQVLSGSQPISHLAATHQVSRKFVYQQGDKAQQALDESFAPSKGDDEVLFPSAGDQKLAVPVDSGLGADLPQFISRGGGTFSRSIRYADQCRSGLIQGYTFRCDQVIQECNRE